ncbi:hypothetical protein [Humibacillus xanthopallidus]|uniref:hypothetical protein n=1 Tax=Humibacillus xanthopallidus TaxID=412689 RepID=UPI00384BD1A6
MATDESSPFRRGQRPAGVTDWHLPTPAFRRLFHDVYIDRAAELSPAMLARAALLVVPDATVSHHSAARLWGGVVLGDSLLRRRRVTVDLLVEAATAHRGTGSRLARRAASLVRADVDSGMETRLRMLMVLSGLPEPVVNHKIRWPDGQVRQRGMTVPPVDDEWRRHFASLPEDLHEPA